jgi:hypothetical protein
VGSRLGGGFTVLHMMNQRRSDIGGIKTLFQQTFDQMILLLVFPSRQRCPQFIQEQARPCFMNLVRCGNFRPLNPHVGEPFNVPDLE